MYIFKFWFEHSGGCIWAENKKTSETYANGVSYVSYSNLPIPNNLIEKLENLDKEYATILDWEYPANPLLWSTSQKLDFYYKANKIRVELQDKLGRNYIFRDEICSSIDLDLELVKIL